jgi:hypothetical protein
MKVLKNNPLILVLPVLMAISPAWAVILFDSDYMAQTYAIYDTSEA